MPSIFTALSPRLYLGIALVVVAVWSVSYVNNLKSDLAEERQAKEDIKTELDEANKNNKLIIEAYEQTIKIEREIAEQKAITQEQKEVVVTKYKTLTKTIEKRGEIKQDEKSNFTIVTF